MASTSSSPVLLLLLLLATLISSSAAFSFPVRHDPKTTQFYTTFRVGSKPTPISAVIDLGAGFLWFSCDNYTSATYSPILCDSDQCTTTGGFGCFGCNRPPRPGCTNNTCGAPAYNPYLDMIISQGFYQDTLLDGAAVRVPEFIFSCMNSDYLEGLAAGATGMLGLARTAISLHKQAADRLNLPDKFAVCFPSSAGIGKLSIGDVDPGNLKNFLKSTPLIVNPVSTAPIFTQGDASFEYFINVTSVRVAGQALSLKDSYFAIDTNGVGGTKISTVRNYTAVHASIYKPLVRTFNKAMSDVKIKSAAAVAPFGACYRKETITGVEVIPAIELVFPGKDVYWRIDGANLMVEIDRKTMCLAIVDSGSRPRTSIVIGAYQLRETYLEFDLVDGLLSFDSSKKSCSKV